MQGQNNKRNIIIGVIVLIIVVAAVIGITYALMPQDEGNANNNQQNNGQQQQNGDAAQEVDIRVDQPRPNEQIGSELTVTGEARGPWYFEAQFPVEVQTRDGEVIATKPATAQGEWMTEDWVPFEVTFENLVWGEAEEGEIVLKRANPSGLPENSEEVHIPIKFGEAQTMEVSVFFSNTEEDPNMLECGEVYEVTREIPQTKGVARAALEELFEGPTQAEQNDGFLTNIPEGVSIQEIAVDKGVAHVEFSRELDENIGGSCLVTAIRAQLRETLLQFPSVTSARISVEGKPDSEVLQP